MTTKQKTNGHRREPRTPAPALVKVIKHPGGHPQIIGYARVSKKSQSLEVQQKLLQEAGCCRVYCEQVSGAASKRPAFEALKDTVRKGDTVTVAALDRLGRRMGQVLVTIDDWAREGIFFHELRHGVNTRGPHGKLFLPFLAALAETERNQCRERVLEGLRKSSEKGGRPAIITPERIALAEQLRKKGFSSRQVGEAMKVGATTVRKMWAMLDDTIDPKQPRLFE
jgi:DNA invertase Pin-like site-specific DNA recombinase